MGWGQGIGIGWPNATSGVAPVPTIYTFGICDCGQSAPEQNVFSLSSNFEVGIYVYNDSELTIPTNIIAGESPNPNFTYTITNGLVGEPSFSCG